MEGFAWLANKLNKEEIEAGFAITFLYRILMREYTWLFRLFQFMHGVTSDESTTIDNEDFGEIIKKKYVLPEPKPRKKPLAMSALQAAEAEIARLFMQPPKPRKKKVTLKRLKRNAAKKNLR